MPIKKGNQKQKQKQKQKQTVIVNINEKSHVRRRRKTTAPLKQQPSNMHMFNPSIINKPSQTNDDVKELLLKQMSINKLLVPLYTNGVLKVCVFH